jgi:hypothetical protein
MHVKISHFANGTSSYEFLPFDNEITIDQFMSFLEKSHLKFERQFEKLLINDNFYSEEDGSKIVSINDINKKTIVVPKILGMSSLKTLSQYDEPYNEVANQCSWFSFEILNNKENIICALNNNNIADLIKIYHKCLSVGTEKRKTFGYLPYGENIDQVENNLNIEMKTTQYGDISMINYLDDDIKSIILRPNMPKESYNTFKNNVENLSDNTMVILNRDGKSFVFVKHNNLYWIFDSHKRSIMKAKNINEINNYILEGTSNGFFYIIYAFF